MRDVAGATGLLGQAVAALVHAVATHLRVSFSEGRLSTCEAGGLIAGLRRWVPLPRTSGASLPDSAHHFKGLWRLHRPFNSEFRTLVSYRLACDGVCCFGSQRCDSRSLKFGSFSLHTASRRSSGLAME